MPRGINALSLAHKFVQEHVRPGDFCIDATAGRGRDTAFLCGLVGATGRVLALDIQQQAVESTRRLLHEQGFSGIAQVVQDSHSHLERYAPPASVDCIMFNFGWLPSGDHSVYTRAETSIPAVEQALCLLRPGGIMSLCIYYGGANGFAERDALLAWLRTVDHTRYTVVVADFCNRPNNPAIPVFVLRER